MEIRRSHDRLISTMGFPILVRWYLYIESGPRFFSSPLSSPFITFHRLACLGRGALSSSVLKHSWHTSYTVEVGDLWLCSMLPFRPLVIGVYVDFSKAFDRVDHTILLSNLSHYDIRKNILQRFNQEFFIACYKFLATYNGVSSPDNAITCGVPQGSILGQVLFYYT